jgi:hypothetical protein
MGHADRIDEGRNASRPDDGDVAPLIHVNARKDAMTDEGAFRPSLSGDESSCPQCVVPTGVPYGDGCPVRGDRETRLDVALAASSDSLDVPRVDRTMAELDMISGWIAM